MSWSRVRLNRVQVKEFDASSLILRGHRIISCMSFCFTISWAFMVLIAFTTILTEPLISIFCILIFSGMYLFLALLMPFYSEMAFDYASQTVKLKEIFLFPFWIKRTVYKIPYASIRYKYVHAHLNEMHLIDDSDNQIELFFGFSREKKVVIIELIEQQLDLTETDTPPSFSIRDGSYLETHFPLLAKFNCQWDEWIRKPGTGPSWDHEKSSIIVLTLIGVIIFISYFPISDILAFIENLFS